MGRFIENSFNVAETSTEPRRTLIEVAAINQRIIASTSSATNR